MTRAEGFRAVDALLGDLAPRLAGRVDGSVAAEGTLERPRGTVSLALEDVAFDTLKDVSGRVDASVETDHVRVVLALSRPADQSLRLEADAALDLPALLSLGDGGTGTLRERLDRVPFRVTATMHGLETLDLPIVAVAGGGVLGHAVLGGDIELAGPLLRPSASGRIEARGLQLGMQPADLADQAVGGDFLDVSQHKTFTNRRRMLKRLRVLATLQERFQPCLLLPGIF